MQKSVVHKLRTTDFLYYITLNDKDKQAERYAERRAEE